jgi:hypothetical protein
LLIAVGLTVLVCALVNVTTYADNLTKQCAHMLLDYEHCEHARYVALIVIAVIVATDVVCCGICVISGGMFLYTQTTDLAHRRQFCESDRVRRTQR